VEIATVDLLSEGRLDIGLGRGHQRYEFERFGATSARAGAAGRDARAADAAEGRRPARR